MSMTGIRIPKEKLSFLRPAPKDSPMYRMGTIVGYTSLKGPFPGGKKRESQDSDDPSTDQTEKEERQP